MLLLLFATGYETPDFVKAFNDIGGLAIAAAAVVGLVLAIGKLATWIDHRREDTFARKVSEVVEPLIRETTRPIQPGTNGGLSLADVHHRLDAIEAKLGIKDRREPDEFIDVQ